MTATTKQPPLPIWAWGFAALCIAIPIVAIGGAIPGALGFGGAGAVVLLAGNPVRPVMQRFALCAAVTLGCWLTFGGIAYAVSEPGNGVVRRVGDTILDPDDYDLDEEQWRVKVYLDVTSRRDDVEQAQAALDAAASTGRSTSFKRQLVVNRQSRYDKHHALIAKWLDITPEELDAIVDEGDSRGWAMHADR